MSEKGDSASFPGEETKKKKGSSSASCSSKDQSSIKMNKRTLLYKKALTHDDVTKFRMVIPLRSGKKFIAQPEKIDRKYRSITMLIMDHDRQIWPMEVTFEELSSSYILWLNWDNYFKRYELEAGDVIFLYFDPEILSFGHFLIEYEKKGSINPPASAIAGNKGNLSSLMVKKPRKQDDINSETKKMGPSSTAASARRRRKDQPSSKINKRTLLYKKSLTDDDVSFCRLKIPLESGRKFLPQPKKYDGVYDKIRVSFVDHEGDIWGMEAAFEEPSSSYMLWLNWDRYLKIFGLEAADVIFFYDVPGSKHYLIEYDKKGLDRNPKDST